MGSVGHNRDEAYTLGDPERHREYYDQWATTYEADFVEAERYAVPRRIALLAGRMRPGFRGRIADIGCGTGLMGQDLRAEGIAGAIDGFDISGNMLEQARRKGVYDRLYCCDMTAPDGFPGTRYQMLVSAGTFTLGHLGPDALEGCFGLAASGALAMIGINAVHFGQDGFSDAFAGWRRKGAITPPVWIDLAIYDDLGSGAGSHTSRLAVFSIFRH